MAGYAHDVGREYLLKLLNKQQTPPDTLYVGLGNWIPALTDTMATDLGEPALWSSASAVTATCEGDAQLDTAQQKFGTASLLVDSAGTPEDAVSFTANSADFDFGSGNFTVEFWFKSNSGSGYEGFWCCGAGSFAANVMYSNLGPDGDLQWVVCDGSSWAVNLNTGANTYRDGAWHHCALVRNGTTWTIYVDGTDRANTTASFTINAPSGRQFVLGRHPEQNGFAGWLDELRVSKGTARYTAGFTAPTEAFTLDANTTALYHFDGDDASTTVTGTKADTSVGENGYVRKAITVNGTNMPVTTDGNGTRETFGVGGWTADGGNLGPFTRSFITTTPADNSGVLLLSNDLEDGETTITDGNTYNLPNATYVEIPKV